MRQGKEKTLINAPFKQQIAWCPGDNNDPEINHDLTGERIPI